MEQSFYHYLIIEVCLFLIIICLCVCYWLTDKRIKTGKTKKEKYEYATITVEFIHYLSQSFVDKSKQIQIDLIDFCKSWSRRWYFSFEILHHWVTMRLNQSDNEHYKEIDNQNFFANLLRFGDLKLKKQIPSIQESINEVQRICVLEGLPKHNDHTYAASAIADRMGITMRTNVKETLVRRFTAKQRELVDTILLVNRASFTYNGELLQEKDLHFVSFCVRKQINKWVFTDKKKYKKKHEIGFDSFSSDLKEFVQRMAAMLPLDQQSPLIFKRNLTFKLLRTLEISELLLLYRELFKITREYLAKTEDTLKKQDVDFRVIPSASNSIQSIPFDFDSLKAVFTHITGQNNLNMLDLFKFHKIQTNKTFVGLFNTDGIKLNLSYDPTDEIRLFKMQVESFKAHLKVDGFSSVVFNLTLAYFLSSTSNLSRSNK